MDSKTSFHTIWNKIEAFEIDESPVDEKALWCGYAKEFSNWLDEWLPYNQNYDEVGINQAKIILFDKYFAWRSFVPKHHQDRIGSRGHICIYQVFIMAGEQLMVAELRLSKPKYYIPPPPPQRPIPEGPALFLGRIDE